MIDFSTATRPLASKRTASPIIAYSIMCFAVSIFFASPTDVTNKKPAMMNIIGAITIPTQKIKSMILLSRASKVVVPNGFSMQTAPTGQGAEGGAPPAAAVKDPGAEDAQIVPKQAVTFH